MVNMFLLVIQLAVTVVVGIYFFRQLRQQKRAQPASRRESSREYEHLRKMRGTHLSEPLAASPPVPAPPPETEELYFVGELWALHIVYKEFL